MICSGRRSRDRKQHGSPARQRTSFTEVPGGGKTDGFLGKWLQRSTRYGGKTKGLFVRRSMPELDEVIARSHEINLPIGAQYRTQKSTWIMPNGALLRLRSLERDADAGKYQGHSYTDVYIDEAGNFPTPDPIDKLQATLRNPYGIPASFNLDWCWLSEWVLPEKQQAALIVINILVPGFLFGERAIRNVTPLITRLFNKSCQQILKTSDRKSIVSHWKDRITGQGKESSEKLLANPNNWRKHPKHQQDALKGVLEEIGWIQQVIVNQTTGHLIDGHLRVELSRSEGETEVPVIYVSLTEEDEKLALTTIDPLSTLAETDQVMPDQLIADIDTDNDQLNELLNSVSSSELLDEPTEGPATGSMSPSCVAGNPEPPRCLVWRAQQKDFN